MKRKAREIKCACTVHTSEVNSIRNHVPRKRQTQRDEPLAGELQLRLAEGTEEMQVRLAVGDEVAVENEEEMTRELGPSPIRETRIPQIPVVIPFDRPLLVPSGYSDAPAVAAADIVFEI